MRLHPSIWLLLGSLILGGLVLGAGCRSITVPEAPPRSTPLRPLWSNASLREHLVFFNGPDVTGRATSTSGYARAAAYVAARMGEFRLQPALAGNAQVIYPTPINAIRAATFLAVGSDTLSFYPGVDYLPDGRSDSGQVEISMLVIDPGGGAMQPSRCRGRRCCCRRRRLRRTISRGSEMPARTWRYSWERWRRARRPIRSEA